MWKNPNFEFIQSELALMPLSRSQLIQWKTCWRKVPTRLFLFTLILRKIFDKETRARLRWAQDNGTQQEAPPKVHTTIYAKPNASRVCKKHQPVPSRRRLSQYHKRKMCRSSTITNCSSFSTTGAVILSSVEKQFNSWDQELHYYHPVQSSLVV